MGEVICPEWPNYSKDFVLPANAGLRYRVEKLCGKVCLSSSKSVITKKYLGDVTNS